MILWEDNGQFYCSGQDKTAMGRSYHEALGNYQNGELADPVSCATDTKIILNVTPGYGWYCHNGENRGYGDSAEDALNEALPTYACLYHELTHKFYVVEVLVKDEETVVFGEFEIPCSITFKEKYKAVAYASEQCEKRVAILRGQMVTLLDQIEKKDFSFS